MNNKPNYNKGTRREITKMLHTGGIIPTKSLPLFDTPRTYKDKLRDMKRENVLAEYKVKNGNRTYRFYAMNDYERNRKKFMDSLPDGYYETYVTYNNILANRCRNKPGATSIRIISSAEAYIMMRAAGVASDPDTKVNLFGKTTIDSLPACYYESREIKNYTGYKSEVKKATDIISNESIKKVVSSRITGLLVSDGGIYAVYNLVDGIQNWQRGGELRMKAHINKLLGDKMENPGEAESCMLITDNTNSFVPLLAPKTVKDYKAGSSFDNLKATYSSIYLLPYTKEGRKLAELMITPGWAHAMKSICLYGYETKDTMLKEVPCDGYTDTEYALLFCVPDLKRLQRFKDFAEENGDKEKFTVICFDMQLEFVARTCRNACSISTVAFDSVYDMVKSYEG